MTFDDILERLGKGGAADYATDDEITFGQWRAAFGWKDTDKIWPVMVAVGGRSYDLQFLGSSLEKAQEFVDLYMKTYREAFPSCQWYSLSTNRHWFDPRRDHTIRISMESIDTIRAISVEPDHIWYPDLQAEKEALISKVCG